MFAAYLILVTSYTAKLLLRQSLRCTVTTLAYIGLDSNVNDSLFTVLPGVDSGDYTVTVHTPRSHCAVFSDWWNMSFAM